MTNPRKDFNVTDEDFQRAFYLAREGGFASVCLTCWKGFNEIRCPHCHPAAVAASGFPPSPTHSTDNAPVAQMVGAIWQTCDKHHITFGARSCPMCNEDRLRASAGSTGGAPTRDELAKMLEGAWNAAYQQQRELKQAVNVFMAMADAILARWPAASRVPSESPADAEGLSVICRECGTLISGVEAGDRVLWVRCQTCFGVRAAVREALTKLADSVVTAPLMKPAMAEAIRQDILIYRDREYPALSSESPACSEKP